MIFHNPPIFVSRSREPVYGLCVCYLGATGKMLFGRIAGSIEFAGSRDLPFDILILLLPGGSLPSLACPSSGKLWHITPHLWDGSKRGPRRGLAWIGLSEPPYHCHLSSCKHSSREREPDRYRHCHVILIPIISLFLFLISSRLESNLGLDQVGHRWFLFFFFALAEFCELAGLSRRVKCRTRWHLILVFCYRRTCPRLWTVQTQPDGDTPGSSCRPSLLFVYIIDCSSFKFA